MREERTKEGKVEGLGEEKRKEGERRGMREKEGGGTVDEGVRRDSQ